MLRISHAFAAALAVAASASSAFGDAVINGSFENNAQFSTTYNLSNANFPTYLPNITSYGSDVPASGPDLMVIFSTGSFPSPPWDNQYLAMVGTASYREEIAFALNTHVDVGAELLINFNQAVMPIFGLGGERLEFGISDSPTDFGTLIYTSPAAGPSNYSWNFFSSGTIFSPVEGDYLTVRPTNSTNTYMGVDNVSMLVTPPVPLPEPATLSMLALGAGALLLRKKRD